MAIPTTRPIVGDGNGVFCDAVLSVLLSQMHDMALLFRVTCYEFTVRDRRRRRGGQEGHVPPIIGEKYFSDNYYVKFWHFRAKIM